MGRSGEFSFGGAEFQVPVKHPSLCAEQTHGHTRGSKMYKGKKNKIKCTKEVQLGTRTCESEACRQYKKTN